MKINKKAFTIIECVIALAIISMISAVAMGIYMRVNSVSSNQWAKFKVVQFANNALKCFQGSDDMNTFGANLKNLSVDNSIVDKKDLSETVDFEADPVLEYDPEKYPVSTDFKTVRVNNIDKKVEFYNHDLNIETTYTDSLATLSYSGVNESKYETDAAYFSKSGIYNVVAEKRGTGGIGKFTYTISGTNESNKKSTYTVTYDYYDGDNKKSNDVYVHISKDGTSVHYKANEFEIYLFNKRYILLPYCYYWSNASGKYGNDLECYVYTLNDSNKLSDTGVEITFNGKVNNYRNANSNWNTETNTEWKPSITEGKDGNMPTGKYTFNYYPLVMYSVAYNGSDDENAATASNASFSREPGGVLYTDYSVKAGHEAKIAYATTDNSKIRLYNSNEMIYQYTAVGTTVSEIFSKTPKTITSARVYTNNCVVFYNGSTPVYSCSYDDAEKFSSDIALLDNTKFFTQVETKNKNVQKVQITAGEMVSGWNPGKEDDTRAEVTYYIDVENNKLRLYVQEEAGNKKELDTTPSELELKLARNGLILYFDENSLASESNELNKDYIMYLYVLDSSTGKKRVNGLGQNMFIRLSYQIVQEGKAGRWNTTSGTNPLKIKAKAIDYVYSYATTIEELKSSLNETYKTYMPANDYVFVASFVNYVYVVCRYETYGSSNAGHKYGYKSISTYYNLSEYTKYEVNEPYQSVTDYFTTTNSSILMAKDSENNDCIIYKYSEGGIPDYTTMVLNNWGVNLNKSEVFIKDTEVMKRWKTLGDKLKLTSVRLYDTQKRIVFYSENTVLYNFDYKTDSAGYNIDKKDITDGPFSQYYSKMTNGTGYLEYVLKSDYQKYSVLRQPKNQTENKFYQVAVKTYVDDVQIDVAVFNAYIKETSYDNMFTEVYPGTAQLDVKYDVRFYAYTFGNHTCLVRAQYSKYSEKTEDYLNLSVEPYIKIWVMDSDKYLIWYNLYKNNDIPPDPTSTPLIYYRKG